MKRKKGLKLNKIKIIIIMKIINVPKVKLKTLKILNKIITMYKNLNRIIIINRKNQPVIRK